MEERASYRNLVVWNKSVKLAVLVYAHAARLPAPERYGLCSQLTRAAASISANIAEGSGRSTNRDYANFISIARGSLLETESFLLLAVELGFVSQSDIVETVALSREIDRMLCGLRTKLLSQSGN